MAERSGKSVQGGKTTWSDVESATDVVTNILSRLPVKTIAQSKTVSHLWSRLTRGPAFNRHQLASSKANPVFVLYPFIDDDVTLHLVDSSGRFLRSLPLPGCLQSSPLSLIASHNGLVCFTNYLWDPEAAPNSDADTRDVQIRVGNPATREFLLLPPGSPSEDEPAVGLVFGPGLNDYKVFRFYRVKEGGKLVTECEAFSPATRVWEPKGRFVNRTMGSHHVFVNGKAYWFTVQADRPEFAGGILSVDDEDNFREVALPEPVDERSFLVDMDGQLALVAIYEYDLVMNVWILKDDDDEEEGSWEMDEQHEIPFSSMASVESVAVVNGTFMLVTGQRYFLYNPLLSSWWERNFNDFFQMVSPVVFPYTESLLTCDGSEDADEGEANPNSAAAEA